MTVVSNTLAAGILLTASGSCGLLRHFLLEPKTPNYPKAPSWLLGVFFIFSTFLIFIGLRYINTAIIGVDTTPPGAATVMVSMSAMLFFYKVSLLTNVLMQRYPAEVWQKLNSINTMVRCSSKK
jgi:hypothetical protein